MKALKLVLVAAILSTAMISYAGIKPDPPTPRKVVKITLKHALTEPGLVFAMRAQLKIGMLQVEPQGLYIGTVNYNRVTYKIYGTRTQWVRFFISTPVHVVKPPNGQ